MLWLAYSSLLWNMMMAIADDEKEINHSLLWFLANFSPFGKILLFNMMRNKAYWLGVSKREKESI